MAHIESLPGELKTLSAAERIQMRFRRLVMMLLFLCSGLAAFCVTLPYLTHQRQLQSLQSSAVKLQMANNAPGYITRNDILGLTQLWDHVVGVQAVGEDADEELLGGLQSHSRIQYLSLHKSPIDPEPLMKFIQTHPKLVVLESIGNPKLNHDVIEQIEKEFPTLTVIWRGSAFLGVSYQEIFNKGLVLEVAPQGPAAKGGMQNFDNLIEFDGTPVHQFEQLISLIGQREPGEMVEIKVLRQGIPTLLNIELGEWGIE